MYALIYKNKVISGPRAWSKAFFNFHLEKHGVKNAQLPKNPPTSFPYVIDSDTKVCEVKEQRAEINPLVHYHRGPLWSFDGDVAVATYEKQYSPLESSKSLFKQLAAEQRYNKESSGVTVNVQGTEVTASTDRTGRKVFFEKLLTISDQESVNWKFSEAWLTVTKSELETIANLISQHVQEAFDWEKDINDQIDACTNHEQLLQITIVEESQTQEPDIE